MRNKTALTTGAALVCLASSALAQTAAVATPSGPASPPVQMANPVSLEGSVSSAEEGPMEGVVVSAKRDGSTMTLSVISDVHGHYGFPANRLGAGHYSLAIRATGYDLAGPTSVQVASGKIADADLKLVRTKNIEAQLTNADFINSVPGTPQQKSMLLNCLDCHTLNRPIESTHNADQFIGVLARMATYSFNSQPAFPQPFAELRPFDHERLRPAAAYLSSINLSAGPTWSYPFKPLPRIKGRGTNVIITEYDLPRKISQPHDVIMDRQGYIWYTDFGQPFIGRLDPKSGAVREFPVPQEKPGSPIGELDLENGRDDTLWVGLHFQGGIGLFDTKTEKFHFYPLPAEYQNQPNIQSTMVAPEHESVDGRVWNSYTGNTVMRLDTKTGAYERIDPFGRGGPRPSMPALAMMLGGKSPLPAEGQAPASSSIQPSAAAGRDPLPVEGQAHAKTGGHVLYGFATDSQNNLFSLDFIGQSIFKIDAKTGQVTEYPTSTLYSRPRRGHMGSQDRLSFAEYNANRIGVLDTKTGHMTEWKLPTPWTAPYDAVVDRNGDAWTAGMTTDRVVRLDTKTGNVIEYQLPRPTNVRRVFVDNRTNPVSFWIGNNHAASIIQLQPLD